MTNLERVAGVSITEALEGRFENMHFTIVCDRCGAEVSDKVLSADFERPILTETYRTELIRHNLSHLSVGEVVQLGRVYEVLP